MAKLSAHGTELYRLKVVKYEQSYRSDGYVLRNYGNGWKVRGTVKESTTPLQAANRARNRANEKRAALPAYRKFRNAACQYALKKRSFAMMAIEANPDDSDGVWSDLDDWYETRSYFSFDDIEELCKLYNAAIDEQIKKAK